MPRPRGAKDKEKRKSRRNQPSFRAEANALADFLGVRPPSGANIPKPPPVQVVNEVSPVSRANVPSNAEEDASRAEEDDDSVQPITGIEAKGTIDPQGIEADFDDGRPAGAGSGYMKLFLDKLQDRINKELKQGGVTEFLEKVVKKHLTHNNYWIRNALFRERRHRNNIDVARRRYLNVPEFGHYDTWLIDLLQKLIEQNTGRLLFPNWQNVTDFQDTEESFVTVPLHSQGLQNKLDETVAAMKAADVSWTPKLTADMKFLCEAWGVKLPFLPVNGKDEFRVFSRIMFRADFARFDSEQMAHLWMEYVNGYTVYPKLPSQLREYHKAWERNKRIKRAEERMKTDSEMLKSFLESKVSIEIEERRSLTVSENEYQQNLYSQEIGRITLPEARLPTQFPVVLPYYFRL
ncbi:hypothetical protein IV203_037862 [Nitzschia inconspicua]|uniref:Uncharacterized protein n=1 Tax=Nitzschia inconspicua TaxID=303405 RepID=A0A9K3PZC5_9STRA|nr:hypothetical protein IV203_037862 [Nitzschia inconspicua]